MLICAPFSDALLEFFLPDLTRGDLAYWAVMASGWSESYPDIEPV